MVSIWVVLIASMMAFLSSMFLASLQDVDKPLSQSIVNPERLHPLPVQPFLKIGRQLLAGLAGDRALERPVLHPNAVTGHAIGDRPGRFRRLRE